MTTMPDPISDSLRADAAALREIFAGLDRLEAAWAEARVAIRADARGYFTPDEDDRVRGLLLAYRNYRLGLYEIVEHSLGFETLADERDRLRAFMIGYAAALTLYAKSLRLVRTYEDDPLVRKKLNEPDAKFGIGEGFFEEILAAYTSPGNYRRIGRAHRFWRSRRRAVRRLGLADDPAVGWLCGTIRRQRRDVRTMYWRVLWHRLRYDHRALWRSLVTPVRRLRLDAMAWVGSTFAGHGAPPSHPTAVDGAAVDRLRPDLRPGDILLVRAEGKITTALIPGFWPHAALFVGDPADLDALGIGGHPWVRPHREAIVAAAADGRGAVVEAFSAGVVISPLEQCLRVDHVLALRPRAGDAERASAVAEAFGHLGKPYDFEFDFNVTTRLVCTEVVYRCWHGRAGVRFDLTKRMGRFTLTGDDIVRTALAAGGAGADGGPLGVAALALKLKDGRAHAVPPAEAPAWLHAILDGTRPTEVDGLPHPV